MGGTLRVGVVGVGTIASALVDSFLTGPRSAQIEVVLSPRSATRTTQLAARHQVVGVAADNQEVLDQTDIVIVSVLPDQIAQVCAELRFRPDHTVVGLAAGWPPTLLRNVVEPAAVVCQLIPLPMVSLHVGPIVMFPEVPAVADLLDGCGELVILKQESEVIVLNCLSAVMSTYFELQSALVDWASERGLRRQSAVDYVTALFLGLSAETAANSADTVSALAIEHETPGGFNEQIRRALSASGTFDELRRQLDDLIGTRIVACGTA